MSQFYPRIRGMSMGADGMVLSKILTSLIGGLIMYWMYIPRPIEILLTMMGIDLCMGMVGSLAKKEFSPRKLWDGILRKFIAFPMLAACDLIEGPLQLTFHLETYFAYALTVYEFLSCFEIYSRFGPVPKVLLMAAEKARELLSTDYGMTTVKTTEHIVEQVKVPGEVKQTVVTHKETVVEPMIVKPSVSEEPNKQ